MCPKSPPEVSTLQSRAMLFLTDPSRIHKAFPALGLNSTLELKKV